MDLLRSKKFWLTFLAVATFAICTAFGLSAGEAGIMAGFWSAGALSQGIADHGKEKAKIEAEIVPNSELEP